MAQAGTGGTSANAGSVAGSSAGGAGAGGSSVGPGDGGAGSAGLGGRNVAGGGVSGGGGAPAAGGSGGVPAGGGAGDCAGAVLCDHFEGTMNAAWMVQPASDPMPTLDSAKGANGSSGSLKVIGTSTQAFLTYPVPGQAFYVRAYMNFETGTKDLAGHGWFIVGADNVTQGGGAQMRFGASGNHGHRELDFNVYGGGCSGEKTQFSDGASDGAAGWNNTPFPQTNLAADKWYCIEAFFNGTGHEFQLWIDETEVQGLHVTEQTMCAGWAPHYTHVKIGAGANSNLGAIWYDDVAVSTSRIHCK